MWVGGEDLEGLQGGVGQGTCLLCGDKVMRAVGRGCCGQGVSMPARTSDWGEPKQSGGAD